MPDPDFSVSDVKLFVGKFLLTPFAFDFVYTNCDIQNATGICYVTYCATLLCL